jgi:hypothetical protein
VAWKNWLSGPEAPVIRRTDLPFDEFKELKKYEVFFAQGYLAQFKGTSKFHRIECFKSQESLGVPKHLAISAKQAERNGAIVETILRAEQRREFRELIKTLFMPAGEQVSHTIKISMSIGGFESSLLHHHLNFTQIPLNPAMILETCRSLKRLMIAPYQETLRVKNKHDEKTIILHPKDYLVLGSIDTQYYWTGALISSFCYFAYPERRNRNG